ncbi:hypothetical protein HK414_01360 [Ramlibacter terrae]|uniref:Uncharacterized protein n=1 Tax=Ramlibacter terrae TaxID=2732511 RepID=A0ABX6NZX8_9BURK|nr:hypothetical protein HK414_01360 [Ramlibacter terrae]
MGEELDVIVRDAPQMYTRLAFERMKREFFETVVRGAAQAEDSAALEALLQLRELVERFDSVAARSEKQAAEAAAQKALADPGNPFASHAVPQHLWRYRRAHNLRRHLDERGRGSHGQLAARLARQEKGGTRSQSVVTGWADGSRPIPTELDGEIAQFFDMPAGGLNRALDQDARDQAKQDEQEGRDPALALAFADLQRTLEEIGASHWKPPERSR